MGTEYDEDEVLARACSSHNTRGLAIAAVTGMYGVGKYGKTLADCFWDRAANRTRGQKKRGDDEKGRISLGLTHAVGSQAVTMINKLGLQALFGLDELDEDTWDYDIDTPAGWERYGEHLKNQFDRIATGQRRGAAAIQIGCYKALDDAWEMVQASPGPNASTLPVVVALSRILNSYGGYAYYDKRPLLFDMLVRERPVDALLTWYASKSDGKARRAQFIRKLVAPYGACITQLGEVDDESADVSTLRDAQKVLRDIGHYSGAIDGDFGPGSEKALKAWCKEDGHDFDDLYDSGQYLLPFARELLGLV